MATSPKLGITLLAIRQTNNVPTANAWVVALEQLGGCHIISHLLTSPPGTPNAGDAYIVAATATGAWVGQEGKIAIWDGTSWLFFAATTGQVIYRASATAGPYIWDGSAWTSIGGGGGGEANTASNVGVAGVGIFKQKTGVDLEFKKINAGSSAITITDDTGNNEVDIDIANGGVALAKMANLATDKIIGRVSAGTGVPETVDFSDQAQQLCDDASFSAMRNTLGLAIGSDVQGFDADLAAIAGLVSAADRGIYYTGSATAALFTLTAAGRDLAAAADAAAQRAALELGTMATQAASAVSITGGTASGTRVNPRVTSQASASSITPNVSTTDQEVLTALAAALTINNPTGTPGDGQKLLLRIKDNGTARVLTWGSEFRAVGVSLPSTTIASQTHYIGAIYNSADSKWDVIATAVSA